MEEALLKIFVITNICTVKWISLKYLLLLLLYFPGGLFCSGSFVMLINVPESFIMYWCIVMINRAG